MSLWHNLQEPSTNKHTSPSFWHKHTHTHLLTSTHPYKMGLATKSFRSLIAHGNKFLPKIVLSSAAAAVTCLVFYRREGGAGVLSGASPEVGRKGWGAKRQEVEMTHSWKVGFRSLRNRLDSLSFTKNMCQTTIVACGRETLSLIPPFLSSWQRHHQCF